MQENRAGISEQTADGRMITRSISPATPVGADRSHAIESDIEQTRGEMSDTLEAIQAKLNPETLKEQAKDIVHDATEQAQELVHEALHDAAEQAKDVMQTATQQAKDVMHTASDQAKEVVQTATEQAKGAVHDATVGAAEEAVGGVTQKVRGIGTTMLETIKQNPMPAALAGIGLGWLYMKRREGGSSSASSAAKQPVRAPAYAATPAMQPHPYEPDGTSHNGTNGIADAASHTAEQAKGMVGGMAGQVQEGAGQAKDSAGDLAYGALEAAGRAVVGVESGTGMVASSMGGQFQRMLEESPLVLGGMALATGAAIGLLLPSTSSEDELLGQTREKLMQQAKQTAKEMQPKVEQVIDEAKSAGQREAQHQLTAAQ